LQQDPSNGAQLADKWGTRETFVAIITTNLPMAFHFCRIWLSKILGSRFQSSQKKYKSPSVGFRSIGGGGDYPSRKGRGPTSTDLITIGMTYTEGEEQMMESVNMQTLETYPSPTSASPSAIVVTNQIDITHETRSSQHSEQLTQNAHEAW
jgi:hypothetical protein